MIAQTAIFVLSMSAIWLANDPRPAVRRFGCVFGLLAQPFWYYETFTHGQWGIFASSFVYTWSWWRGFRHQWLGPSPVTSHPSPPS